MKRNIVLTLTLSLGFAQAAQFKPEIYGLITRTSETQIDGRKTALVRFAVYTKPLTEDLLKSCLEYYTKEFPDSELTCRVYRTDRFGNVYDQKYKNSDNCWLIQVTRKTNNSPVLQKNPILNTDKCRPVDR